MRSTLVWTALAPLAVFVFVPSCLLVSGQQQSDSDARPNVTCNETTFHCLSKDQCVPTTLECDGVPDCADASDELSCFGSCTEFTCRNQNCILMSQVCDGADSCGDGSDEAGCFASPAIRRIIRMKYYSVANQRVPCPPGYFKCGDNTLKCVRELQVCDGRWDCPYGDDEKVCEKCPEFSCRNGLCLADVNTCDGEDNCGDNSDEAASYCARNGHKRREYERIQRTYRGAHDLRSLHARNCGHNEEYVRCGNGCEQKCQHRFKPICSFELCLNGCFCRRGFVRNNEGACVRPKDCKLCGEDQFQCENGLCVEQERVCNGFDDCQDGFASDELLSHCQQSAFGLRRCPRESQLPCETTNLCVDADRLCDDHNDCVDWSDETPEFCIDNGKTDFRRRFLLK